LQGAVAKGAADRKKTDKQFTGDTMAQQVMETVEAEFGTGSIGWTAETFVRATERFWALLKKRNRITAGSARAHYSTVFSAVQYEGSELSKKHDELLGDPMVHFVSRYRLARQRLVQTGGFTHAESDKPSENCYAHVEVDGLKKKIPAALRRWLEEDQDLAENSSVEEVLDAILGLGSKRSQTGPLPSSSSSGDAKANESFAFALNELQAKVQKIENGKGERKTETPEEKKQREERKAKMKADAAGKPCPKGDECWFHKRGMCFYEHKDAAALDEEEHEPGAGW
jgi:hypothetical protein